MIETVRTRSVIAIFSILLTASTSYASSEDAEKLKVGLKRVKFSSTATPMIEKPLSCVQMRRQTSAW